MKKLLRNSKLLMILLMMMLVMSSLVGCGDQASTDTPAGNAEPAPAPADPDIKLATTTSTQNSGLLDEILPDFEEKTGYKVEVIAVGTGAAINMGKSGDADVILVHARAAEDEFVESGYGINRRDVMYNDFLIIGPQEDPAGINGEKDGVAALSKIAETKSTFLSRGDNSGTHKKEIALWAEAGIEPEGEWYKEVGKGMGDTFRMANEMKGYTIIDRGTYLFNRGNYELEALVEGDELFFNPYGVIAVNNEKYPEVNYEGAMKFIEWLTSEETQKMIGEYQVDGTQMFVPNASN